jgi:hypothetical protein
MTHSEKNEGDKNKYSESLLKRFFERHAKELNCYQRVFFHETHPDVVSCIEKNASLGQLVRLDSFHDYFEIRSRLQSIIIDMVKVYQLEAIELGRASYSYETFNLLIDLVLFFDWQDKFGPRAIDKEETPA